MLRMKIRDIRNKTFLITFTDEEYEIFIMIMKLTDKEEKYLVEAIYDVGLMSLVAAAATIKKGAFRHGNLTENVKEAIYDVGLMSLAAAAATIKKGAFRHVNLTENAN